jgi:hypothetical protein
MASAGPQDTGLIRLFWGSLSLIVLICPTEMPYAAQTKL